MTADYRSPPGNQLALRMCTCSPSTIRVLEEPLRRAVLRVLLEQEALSTTRLCTLLTPFVGPHLSDDGLVPAEKVGVALHHIHLPKLRAAGLVAVDAQRGVVSLRPHPDVTDGPLSADLLSSVDQEAWSAIAAIYCDRLRSDLLVELAQTGTTQSLRTLAHALAHSPEVDADAPREKFEVVLHHNHLPALDEAGLVSYDSTSGVVSYTGSELFRLNELGVALAEASK